MSEKRKPFRTLAERLRAIRRRPIPPADIDRFNKIMDEEEKRQREEKVDDKKRKIARPPEADL